MRTLKRLVRRSPLLRVCKTINQTKTVDGGRASFLKSPEEEPTPFRCSGPHSPSRVEGVAGTIAIGRRLRHSESNSGMPCGESLVSSVTQADTSLPAWAISPPSLRVKPYLTAQSGYSRNLLTIAICQRCVNFPRGIFTLFRSRRTNCTVHAAKAPRASLSG